MVFHILQHMPENDRFSQSSVRLILTVSTVFFFIVLVLWAPFGLKSGMPYETTFVYLSETRSLIRGFFRADWLRVHLSFFYHLSYLLAKLLGMDGRFLTYKIVYALLWWGRGILVFLILHKLIPQHPLFNYLIGTLVIVHASDHALNWVGQMHQFGMIFWTVLSFYMLVCSLKEQPGVSPTYVGLSVFFAFMSLWSYESQLLIIFFVPAVLTIFFFGISKRNLAILGTYYVIPATYVCLNILRYSIPHGATYQESVLRKDFEIYPIVSDLFFNIGHSISFWDWMAEVPVPVNFSHSDSTLFSVTAVILFVFGALVMKLSLKCSTDKPFPGTKELLRLLGLGLTFLIMSFPVYLLLDSARMLWRTQFLSGIGAALVMGTVIGLLAVPLSKNILRFMVLFIFGATVSFFGASAAFKAGAFHYQIWERHRHVMAQVLQVAPNLKPDTVIVLVNVPKEADPFGDNMWFDVALRLAYPGTPVSGIYFYEDGTASPGNNLALRSGVWKFTHKGFPPLLKESHFSGTVVIEYGKNGKPRVLDHVPVFLGAEEGVLKTYNPSAAIKPGPPSPLAFRRYLRIASLSP